MEREKDRYVLTFKNNDKEQKIRKFLESKVNATAYLKELCWDVMNNRVSNDSVVNENETINIENIENVESPIKKRKVGGLKNPNK